ncbi:D-lactaldehyde dehydrogenase [Agrocybe pediades]|nr:D-lactaldehyde dehydrogenase [Agrocybe pediades]
MPTVSPNQSKRVLVTGANGFLALWVARTLLEQGYAVRGTARSEEKGKAFLDVCRNYGDQIEYRVVEDITKDGAFDEAVKDVDAIAHLASPVSFTREDPNDLIIPAVKGTMGVLRSALKFGTNVKRIIITSSCAAVMRDVKAPGSIFNEDDWADEAIQAVKEHGKEAPARAKYRASKALAERGAWEFCEQHKDEIQWDLVTILPPVVIGPPLQDVSTPADLNLSLHEVYQAVFTDTLPAEALKTQYSYVHVRDIAEAHIESLKREEAGGNRIIVSAGTETIQRTRNRMYKLYPEMYASGTLPRGNPDDVGDFIWTYNTDRSRRILGFSYRAIEEILRDTVEDVKPRGWLKEGQYPSS